MKFKFFLLILYRYLFSSWAHKQKLRQGFALGTLIPMFGVSIGVFAFIVVLGIMSGFVQNLKSDLIRFTPHIEIFSEKFNHGITADDQFLKQIQHEFPHQVTSISPFERGDAIVQVDNQATLITLEGIEPNNINRVIDLNDYIIMGSGFDELNQPILSVENSSTHKTLFPSAIIGRELALQMNLKVGSIATLVSINLDEGIAPLQMPVVVSGIYDTGRFYLDSKMIYVSLESSNKFFETSQMWSGMMLKLADPFQSESIVKKLNQYLLPYNLRAEAWTKSNSALLKALFLEHLGMIIVMTMIILVGCFSITISLLLSLHRKTRELAILRGLGLTQFDLSKLYLAQGFLIGTVGVIIGLSLGLITLYLVHNFNVPIISNAYTGEPLPVKINKFDIIFASIGSIFLATVAAFWPAFKVRRLNVVDVLAIRQ